MNFYKSLLRPLLFQFEPEDVHHFVNFFIKNYSWLLSNRPKGNFKRNICGLNFENPIGLAAGFDKNAHLLNQIEDLGFGFMEVGTITPKPQIGNERPRIKRLVEEGGLLNTMGFPNDGLNIIAKRLEKRKSSNFIIGANIGKNKHTPNLVAHKDYEDCFIVLQDLVDYFTINLSSPNTPNLKDLLEKEYLQNILESVQNINSRKTSKKPIFLKLGPDMSEDQILKIISTCESYEIDGIISTNTSVNHKHLFGGGISGKPLIEISNRTSEIIRKNSKLKIISSGGIMNSEIAIDRLEKYELIQIYTGLVYEGPNLVRKILKNLN